MSAKKQDIDFVQATLTAATIVRKVLAPTPLQLNEYLSARYDAKIYLKREDLTPVRSYKIRGAFNFFQKSLAHLGKDARYVCASAGNHAQGFAFACKYFGVAGTVYMPITTPKQKIQKTRAFGGENIDIRLIGDSFDQTNVAARAFSEDTNAFFVPPFDNFDIIEGQATVGLEILQQSSNPIDILIIPVGGGGLAAGVIQIMAALSPRTQVVLVEPAGAASLKQSLEKKRRIKLEQIDTFVDGAAVAQIGEINFDILKTYKSEDIILIKEDGLCETIIDMLNVEGIVLEPAGALEIDALRYISLDTLKNKTIVCLTSGGNFDFERLPEVKERALKASGRKKYYILRLPQRPGALREFLQFLGPNDDVSRFEYFKKSTRNFGSILLGIETTEPENFKLLNNKMNKANIQYQDITDDEVVSNFIV
ncbi:MAG: threonine ammonia-lyase IlvA [Hyphomicrobiaceae bacterium]|nr:threonine ammonia-lyase IlvA [Hyphomicrobiaceae bacterium]